MLPIFNLLPNTAFCAIACHFVLFFYNLLQKKALRFKFPATSDTSNLEMEQRQSTSTWLGLSRIGIGAFCDIAACQHLCFLAVQIKTREKQDSRQTVLQLKH